MRWTQKRGENLLLFMESEDHRPFLQGQAEKLGNGKEKVQHGVEERGPIPYIAQPGVRNP